LITNRAKLTSHNTKSNQIRVIPVLLKNFQASGMQNFIIEHLKTLYQSFHHSKFQAIQNFNITQEHVKLPLWKSLTHISKVEIKALNWGEENRRSNIIDIHYHHQSILKQRTSKITHYKLLRTYYFNHHQSNHNIIQHYIHNSQTTILTWQNQKSQTKFPIQNLLY